MKIHAFNLQQQAVGIKDKTEKMFRYEKNKIIENQSIEKHKPLDQVKKDDLKLREASKKLEGQFLALLIKSMESTVPKDVANKQSLSTMMFSTVMGKEMSDNGGIGLADFIYKSLKEQDVETLKKISETDVNNPFYVPALTGDNDE